MNKIKSDKEILDKFRSFLESRTLEIVTPCEGFSVIQFGPFSGRKDGITDITLVSLETGGESPLHKHEKSSATFQFLSGKGFVLLGNQARRVPYKAGTYIEIPAGELHGFEVEEPGQMLSIQTGGSIVGNEGVPDIEYVDARCYTANGALT